MKFVILDVPVHSDTLDELVRSYTDGMLIFHNMDTLNKTRGHAEFREVCQGAELSMIDGQALRLLAMLLFWRWAEKVSGSDFLPAFCVEAGRSGSAKVFLLGAGPGVAERAAIRLNERAGAPVVVGAHSPSFSLLDDEQESSMIIKLIKESGADTLAVGLGAPKQELWLARHRDQMPFVRRFMAVGATFDFEAGRVRRSPRWVSAVGMEWAFRLLMEPRRLWHRYLVEGPGAVAAIVGSRLRQLRLHRKEGPA